MTQLENHLLRVDLGERSYDIVIGSHILEKAEHYLLPLLPLKRVFIITDENVASYHLEALHQALNKAGVVFHDVIIPAGESSKSFSQLQAVLDEMFSHHPERKMTVIALGGGVVGDLAGFASSIMLRGVPFIQIPTTLLAQVDSSVGGKTGINNRFGKNLVGSFYQPKIVLADSAVLETLPMREFLAGYAEVVKYGVIHDRPFFDWLVANEEAVRNRDKNIIEQAVLKSCQSKADIVSQDEKEGGVRALLNLGHTFGHALEAELGYDGRILHGEGVAIGMVMALAFSNYLGLCDRSDVEILQQHLHNVGLFTHPKEVMPKWSEDALISHMKLDKKVADGKMVFILAHAIGKSFIQKDVQESQVRLFLEEFLKAY